MKERKTMVFGRKYRAGNYTVIKFNKVLRKSEIAELRMQAGIPSDIRKHLERAQLPYVKVYAVSGIWSIEFCCNTSVYRMIDTALGEGGEKNETMLAHLFNMWYMDTAVPGDEQYLEDKAMALKAFTDRHKAADVSDEEDGRILDELKADEEAKATIIEMGNSIKEGNDGGE